MAALNAAAAQGFYNNRLRASVLRQLGQYGDALATAEWMVQRGPEDIDGNLLVAYHLMDTPAKADAERHADAVLGMSPLEPRALMIKARLAFASEDPASAKEFLARSLVFGAYDPSVMSYAAQGLASFEETQEDAVDLLSRLAELGPADPFPYTQAGGALAKLRPCWGAWHGERVLNDLLVACGRVDACGNLTGLGSSLVPMWRGWQAGCKADPASARRRG